MALDEAGVQLIAAGVAAYINDLGKADKSTNDFYGTLGNAGPAASGFQQVITGALREAGAAIFDFGVNAAKAFGGFVKDSVGLAGDFQQGMLNFQSVAGKEVDTKGLEQFRDLFLQLGKELPVSTSEVQLAATEMVKGGIDPATIAAGGLRQNIQFAAAAMEGDLVKAAEISSKIMGGWTSMTASAADKSAFLTHATDLLTKAANASATDVEGLSRGIFQAQGIAKTAGVSFDDLTTTLAELAPRFASSAEAGTSLKNMIARLQPTTDPATQAMSAIGLYTEAAGSAFYDAAGNFVGFEQASQLLQNSLKGLTKEQQANVLQTIFGNDAMGSAAALAELGASGYTSMAAALDNANGVSAAAELKQQGFNTALDNAKGSVEALQITIGTALLPILTDLMNTVIAPAVNTLTDFASALFGDDQALAKLSPTMQGFVSLLGNLASYFAAVAEDGDYLNDFLSDLPGPIQAVVGGIGMLIAAFGPLQSYIRAVVEDGDYLNDFLADVPAPMQGIVEIVGRLIAAFGSAGDSSSKLGGVIGDLSGIWKHASDVIADVMDAYMSIAKAVLPIVTTFWTNHGTEISAFVTSAYDKIISIVNRALDLYDAIVPKVLSGVAGFITAHAAAIQTILGGAWNVMSGVIDGALTLIEGIIRVALDLIHGDWAKAWTDIQQMSAAFVLDLEKVISGFLDIIAGFFDSSLADIAKTWEDNWNMLVDIATQTDWVKVGESVVGGILQGLKDNWDRLMGWVADKAKGLAQAALDAIGAGSPAVTFIPVGQFAVLGIMEGFSREWPQLSAQLASLGGDLASQAQSIAEQAQSAIADAFGATASIDRQMAKNFDRLGNVGSDFLQAYIKQSLDAEQKIAEGFSDPKAGAAYFKMVSDNIFETAALQKKIDEAQTQEEKDRLQAQYVLISRAQDAEMSQFQAKEANQTSPVQDIAGQLNDFMRTLSGINLTQDQIHLVDLLSGLWLQLQHPSSAPYVNPTQAGSSYSQSTTVNMPVYTNMSPSAIQDSMAIAGAALL